MKISKTSEDVTKKIRQLSTDKIRKLISMSVYVDTEVRAMQTKPCEFDTTDKRKIAEKFLANSRTVQYNIICEKPAVNPDVYTAAVICDIIKNLSGIRLWADTSEDGRIFLIFDADRLENPTEDEENCTEETIRNEIKMIFDIIS